MSGQPNGWETAQPPHFAHRPYPASQVPVHPPYPALARPTYREPSPVRASRLTWSFVAGLGWMTLLGAQGSTLPVYAWITLIAGLLTWATAALLVRQGDRGVAVGLAMAAGLGVSVATLAVAVRWAGGEWPLW